jgi:hypothetical protein
MKVSSPIGDLPFEPRKLSFRDRRLEIEGVMGAWPAHVQISGADLPAIARVLAKPAAIAAAAAAVIVGAASLGRPKSSSRPERND